jgi:hypothetical protein
MVAAGYTFKKDNKAWKPSVKRGKAKKNTVECEET